MAVPAEILKEYGVRADNISKVSAGLINETYLIGAGGQKFILQKLNPIFGSDVNFDRKAVSGHLAKKGLLSQSVIPARSGALFAEKRGEVWRLLDFIPGKIFAAAGSPDIVYEAGRVLGEFHSAVADMHYEFRHIRPMHHATRVFAEKFTKLAATADGYFRKVAEEIPNIGKLYLPGDIPKAVTHGDPKITNIIFAEFAPGIFKGKALVDLDDCGSLHNVLIELGDAFRSWCGAGEDSGEKNFFDMEKFKAGLKGYLDGFGSSLSGRERELLPSAVKLITLELTMRFLIDYCEDNYFGWDPGKYASRKEHNLARARGQLALFKDIEAQSAEIGAIIDAV